MKFMKLSFVFASFLLVSVAQPMKRDKPNSSSTTEGNTNNKKQKREVVYLKTSDDEIIEVALKLVQHSETIKNMREDLEGLGSNVDAPIPLHNISSKTLKLIIKYLKLIEKHLSTIDPSPENPICAHFHDDQNWPQDDVMYEVILAANYLDIPVILNGCIFELAQKLASTFMALLQQDDNDDAHQTNLETWLKNIQAENYEFLPKAYETYKNLPNELKKLIRTAMLKEINRKIQTYDFITWIAKLFMFHNKINWKIIPNPQGLTKFEFSGMSKYINITFPNEEAIITQLRVNKEFDKIHKVYLENELTLEHKILFILIFNSSQEKDNPMYLPIESLLSQHPYLQKTYDSLPKELQELFGKAKNSCVIQ